MEIYIQDLKTAIPLIQKHFSKYPTASISAMYRKLRSRKDLSSFGDYPIISIIVSTVLDMGLSIKRASLRRAFRQSSELKGKTLLLNQLINDEWM
jgi:hypothetical protein